MTLINGPILITGGLGQIGNFLVKRLIGFNQMMYIIDRPEMYNEFKNLFHDKNNLNFIGVDISNLNDLKNVMFKDIEIIIHLASNMSNSMDVVNDAIPHMSSELGGTINLIELCPNLTKIIYTSSMVVYGIPQINPVDELHSIAPQNLYALAKLVTEHFIKQFCEKNKKNFIILRLSSVYGPWRYQNRAIPVFIKSMISGKRPTIQGNGDTKRDYIYVEDVVDVIIKSLQGNRSGIFNIGTGEPHSLNDLVETINKILHYSIIPIYNLDATPGYDFYYNIKKAKNELAFKPKTSFHEGIKLTIDWYNSQRNGSDVC
jgi:nucleoside-diphosphate-sugar epimerase